jgi:ABC-2 type transport system permease protein
MRALLLKEINSFLNSLIGYIVIGVFLLFVGLFMWVLPTDANVLENGYADLSTLFTVAPWVFLFLIPAITMRSFADEKSTGTIELLHTRPISDLQIIIAKYFAGVFLVVLFSLLPTLIYYFSVHQLGNPTGNIDTGSMWGSYIGLLLLG